MTLRGSRADVRGGKPSEARLLMPAETGMSRSENPRILMWGMGGAAAGFSLATAARRARAGTEPHHPDAHLRKGKGPLAVTPAGLLEPRQRPTFPLPRGSSIMGLGGLNVRVRDGNGWGPLGYARIHTPFALISWYMASGAKSM